MLEQLHNIISINTENSAKIQVMADEGQEIFKEASAEFLVLQLHGDP